MMYKMRWIERTNSGINTLAIPTGMGKFNVLQYSESSDGNSFWRDVPLVKELPDIGRRMFGRDEEQG